MGEFGGNNGDNKRVYGSKSDYLATLTPEQAGKLDRISAHRDALGLPDWFCGSSPTHAHYWEQAALNGPWRCVYCGDKMAHWPTIDKTQRVTTGGARKGASGEKL